MTELPSDHLQISMLTISFIECLIILLLVAVIAAIAFRTGYFRGRNR
ncbi:hypothetical protein [Chloroflexus sp. Y-396-1]|nr:hypothetical protein [Chloroflexus sp. Y-396-1]